MPDLSQLRLRGIIYDLVDKTKIPLSDKGIPNGVATLDENGQIPASQIGNLGIKYGTKAELESDLSFIPSKGQIVIYKDKAKIEKEGTLIDVPGIKVGDGLAYLVDLPFVGDEQTQEIIELLKAHIDNHDIHVTLREKESWNNKLNYALQEENLILNRL